MNTQRPASRVDSPKGGVDRSCTPREGSGRPNYHDGLVCFLLNYLQDLTLTWPSDFQFSEIECFGDDTPQVQQCGMVDPSIGEHEVRISIHAHRTLSQQIPGTFDYDIEAYAIVIVVADGGTRIADNVSFTWATSQHRAGLEMVDLLQELRREAKLVYNSHGEKRPRAERRRVLEELL